MLFNDRYEIDLTVDDTPFDVYPTNFKFTCFDSIFNLYSKSKLVVNDLTGLFNEGLAFVNGTKVEITLGNKNTTNTCPYVIVKNSLVNQPVQSKVGGSLELSMLNKFYYSQSKLSQAYRDEISNIVKNRVTSYGGFSSLDIEATSNLGLWFQPLMTDQEFFTDILLPNAYSSSSNSSPFYMFTDSKNVFHFKSYVAMMNQNPVATLTLPAMGTVVGITDGAILKINPIQQSNLKLEKTYNRNAIRFDKNGSLIKNPDLISSYPIGETLPIPAKKNLAMITDNLELYDDDIVLAETANSNLGIKANSVKEAFHTEKIAVTTPYNPAITSGQTLTISVPTSIDATNVQPSSRYSGKYVIESSYATWNGVTALTIATVSRQVVKVPSSYRNKSLLVRGN